MVASASLGVILSNRPAGAGSHLWWPQQRGHVPTLGKDQAEPGCGTAFVVACEAIQVVLRGNIFNLYSSLFFYQKKLGHQTYDFMDIIT